MDELFSGIEIASKVKEVLEGAKNYIYIMQFLLFDVKNVYDGKKSIQLNLIELLKQKNDEGIEVKIILNHPRKLSDDMQPRQFVSLAAKCFRKTASHPSGQAPKDFLRHAFREKLYRQRIRAWL